MFGSGNSTSESLFVITCNIVAQELQRKFLKKMIKIHKRPFKCMVRFWLVLQSQQFSDYVKEIHYHVIGTTGYGRSKGVTSVGDKHVFIEKTTLNFEYLLQSWF